MNDTELLDRHRVERHNDKQISSETLKEKLSQKRDIIFSKLTSSDSDVSI